MACSLLSLAHVYGATELERNCLVVMKANMAQGEARRISPLTTARAQTRECASHLVPRSRAVVTRADFHFAPAALGPLAPEPSSSSTCTARASSTSSQAAGASAVRSSRHRGGCSAPTRIWRAMKFKVLLRKRGGARARAAGAESSFWRPDLSMVHAFYVYLMLHDTTRGGGAGGAVS